MLATSGCGDDPDRLFIGDSITAPYEAASYVDRIAEERPRERAVNAGCGSTTTWQWSLLDQRAPGRHCQMRTGESLYERLVAPWGTPKRVYILLGTNDSEFHASRFEETPVEPDDYQRHLSVLIDRLEEDGVKDIVLLSPPFVADIAPLRNRRLAAYRVRLRALCEERPHVRCGPDLSRVLTGPEDYSGPRHPSEQGQAKIAEAILAWEREAGAP